MDDRGYWHNKPDSEAMKQLKGEMDKSPERSNDRPRYVFECAIGEGVEIAKENGQGVLCRFDSADKNRVTLSPTKGALYAPLEFGERIMLKRSNGDGVPAQVWDHRNGKIILRTLPVGV